MAIISFFPPLDLRLTAKFKLATSSRHVHVQIICFVVNDYQFSRLTREKASNGLSFKGVVLG